MKTITQKIYENQYSLFGEVQNEIDKNAAYQSFDYSAGSKKYKKGFITFNKDQEFISIVAFNKYTDLNELFGNDVDYKELDSLKIAEYSDIDEQSSITKYTRIW